MFRAYPRYVTTEEKDIAICSSLVFSCMAANSEKKRQFSALQSLKYKNAPGYGLITPKLLNEIPLVRITLSAILWTHSFPIQWKIAQVIMIMMMADKPSGNPFKSFWDIIA